MPTLTDDPILNQLALAEGFIHDPDNWTTGAYFRDEWGSSIPLEPVEGVALPPKDFDRCCLAGAVLATRELADHPSLLAATETDEYVGHAARLVLEVHGRAIGKLVFDMAQANDELGHTAALEILDVAFTIRADAVSGQATLLSRCRELD